VECVGSLGAVGERSEGAHPETLGVQFGVEALEPVVVGIAALESFGGLEVDGVIALICGECTYMMSFFLSLAFFHYSFKLSS
jgi:hypothetical protein